MLVQNFIQLKPVNNVNKPVKNTPDNINNNSGQYLTFPYFQLYNIYFGNKKQYTQNELEFINFRKNISTKLHKAQTERALAEWNFFCNATDENEKIFLEKENKCSQIFLNENNLEKLKQFQEKGINEPTLKRHLNDLLKEFDQNITYKEELTELTEKEIEINKKFSGYRGIIDEKERSNTEIFQMIEDEKDVNKRKEIYRAKVGGGDLIAKDLVQLIKIRNNFAQKLGYPDFYTYKLKEYYEVDKEQLFQLMTDLDEKTNKSYNQIIDRDDKKLAKTFNITTEELYPWHYGFKDENSLYREADSYIKDNNMLLPSAFSFYKKMGWDLSNAPIEFDLFPRENKNQHCFSFGINIPKDCRILANLTNDTHSLEQLYHETGHSLYDLGISDHIPYLDKTPTSHSMTESFAMLMESTPYREPIFWHEEFGMPCELLKKLENKRKENLIYFVKKYIFFINFEREMYKNPDQDLSKLWFDLKEKHLKTSPPDKLNNEWATIPHFITHPGYLQNYLRAEVMAAQIYKAASNKLGPLTQNLKTADYFNKNMFRPGKSLDENEIMKKLTGDVLKPDAFCEQIQDIEISE